ncbi:MAG TPA: MarR family transcriptional regulator [Gaiellaceae bacterium]|jgi:MarR family transcriptional regulator for hemolysin|nr:MarR family transcriptional regulator [Gaiellaceae bacterium]
MEPGGPPVGLHLAATAKAVSRAFNAALAEAGGSLPMWLILTSLRGEQWRTQHELARSLGIEGPTLTRHLDALEGAGLVERRRDPADRRAIQVELTRAGEELHSRLRRNVIAFDRQLRAGLGEAELKTLRSTLRRLEQNVASPKEG